MSYALVMYLTRLSHVLFLYLTRVVHVLVTWISRTALRGLYVLLTYCHLISLLCCPCVHVSSRCQLFDREFPNNGCGEMLFKNVLRRAREAAGMSTTSGQVRDLIEFFCDQQRTAAGQCSFNLDLDEQDKCSRIFFMSAEMETAFRRNGQFVVMDATCKTTRFALQLVLLVGIDQTFQSTLFAVGLVAQEDIESYSWLLRAVRAVVGQQSLSITLFTRSSRTVHALLTCLQ